jgi:hypothetical protein
MAVHAIAPICSSDPNRVNAFHRGHLVLGDIAEIDYPVGPSAGALSFLRCYSRNFRCLLPSKIMRGSCPVKNASTIER